VAVCPAGCVHLTDASAIGLNQFTKESEIPIQMDPGTGIPRFAWDALLLHLTQPRSGLSIDKIELQRKGD
jgi:hypothetical protein